jgi:hypothetical protein
VTARCSMTALVKTPQSLKEITPMIRPITAYLVSRGVYDEYQVLAVFTEHRGAQDFVDHHNLSSARYSADDKARVEEVDLYGPGWRRPPSEVLDGEVMDPPLRLILDEAATICPVPLDEWLPNFGSHGITCVMNPRTPTATDPCPDCGGFDSTHWADSEPGWVEWHCRCGHDWAISVDESDRSA